MYGTTLSNARFTDQELAKLGEFINDGVLMRWAVRGLQHLHKRMIDHMPEDTRARLQKLHGLRNKASAEGNFHAKKRLNAEIKELEAGTLERERCKTPDVDVEPGSGGGGVAAEGPGGGGRGGSRWAIPTLGDLAGFGERRGGGGGGGGGVGGPGPARREDPWGGGGGGGGGGGEGRISRPAAGPSAAERPASRSFSGRFAEGDGARASPRDDDDGGDAFGDERRAAPREETRRLEVSADVARNIVGVTGAAVKQLQDRTGATVQVSRVDRGEHDDGNRSVVISGAWPCVDAAVEEVRRVMSKYQPRNRDRDRERDRDRGRKRDRSPDASPPSSSKRGRSTTACRFFNTRRGCRDGDKCMFSHGDGASPARVRSPPRSRVRSPPVPRTTGGGALTSESPRRRTAGDGARGPRGTRKRDVALCARGRLRRFSTSSNARAVVSMQLA